MRITKIQRGFWGGKAKETVSKPLFPPNVIPRFWEPVIGGLPYHELQMVYRHDNPGKPGHVSRGADWPDYSFPRNLARGIYPLRMGGR